jgi:uncharacterized RDD family membrane protein YckC
MKCPQCGFISFDNLVRCKKCGADFSYNVECINHRQAELVVPCRATPSSIRPAGIEGTIETIKRDLEALDRMPTGTGSSSGFITDNSQFMHVINRFQHVPEKENVRRAGFLLRLLAYSIDIMIIFMLSLLLMLIAILFIKTRTVNTDDPFTIMRFLYLPYLISEMVIEAFYFIFFHAVTGQTVGKRVCGLRVLGVDGGVLGFRRSIIRFMGYLISRICLYLGFVWIALSSKKQGWHDKMAKSCVIRI